MQSWGFSSEAGHCLCYPRASAVSVLGSSSVTVTALSQQMWERMRIPHTSVCSCFFLESLSLLVPICSEHIAHNLLFSVATVPLYRGQGSWVCHGRQEQLLGSLYWLIAGPYTTFLLPLVHPLAGAGYPYTAGIFLFATWALTLVNSDLWPLREVMRGIFSADVSHLSLAVSREIQNSNSYMFLKMGVVGGWTFCYDFLLRIYYVGFFLRSFTDLEVTNVALTKPSLSLKAKAGGVL